MISPMPAESDIASFRPLLTGKRILLLGGGVMQLPLLQIAIQLGMDVCVVDGNPNALAVSQASAFFHVDLKDHIEIARQASAAEFTFDGVCTIGTDFTTAVAYVAEKLGLPGISLAAAEKAKYKHLMRQAFQEAGVSVPPFIVCSSGQEEELEKWDTFPAVVKPVDNMGARGVQIVSNYFELLAAVQDALGNSHSNTAIVEGFIQGREFSIDAVWVRGKLEEFGIADRHIYFPPYRVELGHSFPADLKSEERQKLLRLMEDGSRALGITQGAVKGDIFWDGQSACIGELAARLSGGFMSGWTYPLHAQRSAILPYLCSVVGVECPENHNTQESLDTKTVLERACITFPGKIQAIYNKEKALEIPGVEYLWFALDAGDVVGALQNNVGKCGNIIVRDPESATKTQNMHFDLILQRNRIEDICRQAVESIRIDMYPNKPESLHFLLNEDFHTQTWFDLAVYPGHTFDQIIAAIRRYVQSRIDAGQDPALAVPIGFSSATVTGKDWLGRDASDHFQLCKTEGLLIEDSTEDAVYAAVFRAIARAGIDGVRYLVQSCIHAL